MMWWNNFLLTKSHYTYIQMYGGSYFTYIELHSFYPLPFFFIFRFPFSSRHPPSRQSISSSPLIFPFLFGLKSPAHQIVSFLVCLSFLLPKFSIFYHFFLLTSMSHFHTSSLVLIWFCINIVYIIKNNCRGGGGADLNHTK